MVAGKGASHKNDQTSTSNRKRIKGKQEKKEKQSPKQNMFDSVRNMKIEADKVLNASTVYGTSLNNTA